MKDWKNPLRIGLALLIISFVFLQRKPQHFNPYIPLPEREEVSTAWTQLRLAYTSGKHRVQTDAGYKYVTDDYRYNSVAIANANKSGPS